MRRLHPRLALVGLLALLPALLAVGSLGPASAVAQASSGLSLPIVGTLNGGTFEGTVSQLLASDQNGLTLGGVLNGLAQIGKDTVRVDNLTFSSPVKPAVVGSVAAKDYHPGAGAQGTAPAGTPAAQISSGALLSVDLQTAPACDVLYLDLQPIHLNLLGLDLQTSRITLDLKGIPGSGNLLGNLICDLSHLLDGTPNAIGQITTQLNQVLSGAGVAAPNAATANSTAVATQAPTTPAGNAATQPTATVPTAATPIG